MQSEPTTFEETMINNHATLPSITFCIDYFGKDNFVTMQDISRAIEKVKKRRNAWLFFHGKGIQKVKIDLKNPSLLKSKLNASFQDVWKFMATVSDFSTANIMICSSLNMNINLPAQGSMRLEFQTCSKQPFNIRFERHEAYQSNLNYQFDKKSGYQYYKKGVSPYYLVTPVETKALKKGTHDCYEDNSMKKTECVDDYFAEQLNCSLPWARPYPDYGICNGNLNLTKFRSVHSKISSKQTSDILKKKGCLKPNCLQTKWIDSYVQWAWINPNCTKIIIGLQSDSYTIRRKEILLADFSTFMVDCGSYLGLFLGASILSLSDSILSYIIKAFRK